jgi:hypothetical protein
MDALAASGIVGLSPTDMGELGDLFIHQMKKSGTIDESIFALSINLLEDNSKI